MSSNSPLQPNSAALDVALDLAAIAPAKPPRPVLEGIVAFPPNRHTLGGTAYMLQEPAGNILIDCPAWNPAVQDFIQQQGGIRWLFLTHRNGVSHVRDIQQAFGCEIVLQEQEAYLLPGLTVTSFQDTFRFGDRCWAMWTPGYSPGSACLYSEMHGGVLFSGRHLLPNQQGEPTPLRIAKTFHWKRQIQSVQRLLDQFTPETLNFICPAANIGFLRGQHTIERAYQRLAQLDLQQRLLDKPGG